VHLLIGDVSGHGPDEAALGVALRIAWRTLVLSDVPLERRVHQLEQILVAERSREHIFATLTSVSVLPDARTARIVRAGHPGMFVRRGGAVELLEVDAGPALGLLPAPEWPVEDLDLPEEQWSLVLFTDGLFEGRTSADGDRLEEEGLLAVARDLQAGDSDRFVDGLIAGAQALSEPYGGLVDDVAVVHVRRRQGA
jgi:serine phosphatase RsbU (regulator of sigma subunit)